MSVILDGIAIVECGFIPPGQAFLFNNATLKFDVVAPFETPTSEYLDRMRYSLYQNIRLPDHMMILDSDLWDPPVKWSPRKYRGPRRKSHKAKKDTK